MDGQPVAGRDLDIRVASKVMGIPWAGGNPIARYDGRWPWPPPYSSDGNAMLAVLVALRGRGWRVVSLGETSAGSWTAVLAHEDVPGLASGVAADLPTAVCRAALMATGAAAPPPAGAAG